MTDKANAVLMVLALPSASPPYMRLMLEPLLTLTSACDTHSLKTIVANAHKTFRQWIYTHDLSQDVNNVVSTLSKIF